MKINLKRSIAMCAVVLLAACGNNASNNSSNIATTNAGPPVSLTGSPLGNAPSNTAQSADAYTPLVNLRQDDSPMKARDMSAAPVAALVALGAPVASQTAIAKQAGSSAGSGSGKPLQIGFSRDVAQTGTSNATKQVLKWQATAVGGQVAAINFNSSGAKGLRVGLLVTQLPASATLRFYAKGAATAYEVTGADVQRGRSIYVQQYFAG